MSDNKFRKSKLRNETSFLPFKPTKVLNTQNIKIKSGSPHINLKALADQTKVSDRLIAIKSSLSQNQYVKEDKIVKLNYKKGQHILHQAICTNSAYSLHNNLKLLQEKKELEKYKSFLRCPIQNKHGRLKNVNKCLARQKKTAFTREHMAGDNNLSKRSTKLRKHILASYSDRSNISIEFGQHAKQFSRENIRRLLTLRHYLLISRSSLTKSQILVLKNQINDKNKSSLKTSLSYSTIKHDISEKYNTRKLGLRKATVKSLHQNKNYKDQFFSNPTYNIIDTYAKIKKETTFSNDWKKPKKVSANIFHQNIGNKMKNLTKQKNKCRKDNILKSNSDKIYNHQLIKYNRLHSKLKINTETSFLPQSGCWNRKSLEDEIKSSKKTDHIILRATGTRNENKNNKVAVIENKFVTNTLTSSSKQPTNSVKKLICQLWDDQSNNNVNEIKASKRNLKAYSSSCSKSRRSIEIKKMQRKITNQSFPCVQATILNTGEDEMKINEVTMFKKLYGYLNIFGSKRADSDQKSKFVNIDKKNSKQNIDLNDSTIMKLRDIGCTTIRNKEKENISCKKYDCNKIDVVAKKLKTLKKLDNIETKYSESGKKRTPRKLKSSCDKTDMRVYPKRCVKIKTRNNIPVMEPHEYDIQGLAELGYFDRKKNLQYYRLFNNINKNKDHRNLDNNKKVTQNQNSKVRNKISTNKANRKTKKTIEVPVSAFNQNIYHRVTRLSNCHRKFMKRKQTCHHFSLKKKGKYKFLSKYSNKTNKDPKKLIPDLEDLHSKQHIVKVLQDSNNDDEQPDESGKRNKKNKPRKDSANQWSNHDYFIKNATSKVIDNPMDFGENTIYKIANNNKKDVQSRTANKCIGCKSSQIRILIKTVNDKKVHVKFSDESVKDLPVKEICRLKYQHLHDEDFLNDKNIKDSIKILRAKQNELKKHLQAFDDDIIRKKLEWYEKIKKELHRDLQRRCKTICGKRCCAREKSLKFGDKIFLKCHAAKKRFTQIVRSGIARISAGKFNFETQDNKGTVEIIKANESKQTKLKVKGSKTKWQCGCEILKKSSKKLSEKNNFLLSVPYMQSEDNFGQDEDKGKSETKCASENAFLKARRNPKSSIPNVHSNSNYIRNKQQIKSYCPIQNFQDENIHHKGLKCTHIKNKISKEMENIIHRNMTKNDRICLQTTSNSYKDVRVIKKSSSTLEETIKNVEQGSALIKKQNTHQNEETTSSSNGKDDKKHHFPQTSDKSSKHNVEAINWIAELEKMYEQIRKCSAQIKELNISQNIGSKKNLSKHSQSSIKVKKENTQQPVISKVYNDHINYEHRVSCACAPINDENKKEVVETKNNECFCPPTDYICIPPKVCCINQKMASKDQIVRKNFENKSTVNKQNLKHWHKVGETIHNNQGILVQVMPENSKQLMNCDCQNINKKKFKHETLKAKVNHDLEHQYSRSVVDNIQKVDSCRCTVEQKTKEFASCNCQMPKELYNNCERECNLEQKNSKYKTLKSLCQCSLPKVESFHKKNNLKPVPSTKKNCHFETGCNCQKAEEETFGVSVTPETLQMKCKNYNQKLESQSSQSKYEINQIQQRKSKHKNDEHKITTVLNKLRTLFHKHKVDKPNKLYDECRCTKLKKENFKLRTECNCHTNLKLSKHGIFYKFLRTNSKSKATQIKRDNSKFKVANAKRHSSLQYTDSLGKNKSAPDFMSKRKESDQKIYCECQKLKGINSKNEKPASIKQIKSNKFPSVNTQLKGKYCSCHSMSWKSTKNLPPQSSAKLKGKENYQKVYSECKKIKEMKPKHGKTKDNKLAKINSQSKEMVCGCGKKKTKSKKQMLLKNDHMSKNSLQRKERLKQPFVVKCKCLISKRIAKVRKRTKTKRKRRKNIRKKRKPKPLPAPIAAVKHCFIDTYNLLNNYKCNRNFLGLTLQKRPCFCIYKICPSLYPYFLNGLSCISQSFRLCMLALGFMIWFPCMLCTSCLFCKKCC